MLQLSIQSSYIIIASVSPTQFFELIERDISILSSRLMPEFSTRHDTFLFRELWFNLKAENTIDQLSNYRGIVDPKRNILHACVRRAELGDLLTLWE